MGGTRDAQSGDYDVHVKPYWHTCDVCNIRYKFIAKTETLDEDTEVILNRVNATDVLPVEKRRLNPSRGNGNETSERMAAEMAKSVPKSLMRRLIDIYEFDFKAFGYDYEKYLI